MEKYHSRPREEAGEKIECYIAQNNLEPHDKLPSERDMCKMWGFNRMTLRSAIARLIYEGKLYNRKGSGTFVAPPKLERNLQDLKSFSDVVKEHGKELETKVLSIRIMESNKQISQKLQLFLGSKVLELIRMRIIDNEPVMIETTYVDYNKYNAFDEHDFSKESLYGVIEKDYGMKIAQGTEKVAITFATEEEAKLLQIEEGEPLYYITGVVSDENNNAIEYFKSVARSDKMRFSSVLTR